MVLSGPDGVPHVFELPEDITPLVNIEHPTLPGIQDLGLKWYGLPGVSGMLFECGGVQFPGSPFSGWYAETEVATRDFLDEQRYNLSEVNLQ